MQYRANGQLGRQKACEAHGRASWYLGGLVERCPQRRIKAQVLKGWVNRQLGRNRVVGVWGLRRCSIG